MAKILDSEILNAKVPKYIELKDNEDNVRIYRITGKGKVTSWGTVPEFEEEIILI